MSRGVTALVTPQIRCAAMDLGICHDVTVFCGRTAIETERETNNDKETPIYIYIFLVTSIYL
jgi:hypothetical protein